MEVERNGKVYLKVGHTEFLKSDVQGKTKEELENRYHYLPSSVIRVLSDIVSPKVTRKKKSKNQEG